MSAKSIVVKTSWSVESICSESDSSASLGLPLSSISSKMDSIIDSSSYWHPVLRTWISRLEFSWSKVSNFSLWKIALAILWFVQFSAKNFGFQKTITSKTLGLLAFDFENMTSGVLLGQQAFSKSGSMSPAPSRPNTVTTRARLFQRLKFETMPKRD